MIQKGVVFLLLATFMVADSISFEDVVQKAIKNNLELQILDSKKEVAKASIDEIDALYYPSVSLGLNTQYTKDLQNSSGVSSIGGSFLSDSSGYESSSTFRVDYELYNFGVTDTKVAIATIEKDKIEYEKEEKTQELKLNLLEIYGKILDSKNQLFYYQKIQELNKDIYQLYKRLFGVKKIDKLTLANQAIKILELDTQLNGIKDSLKKSFVELEYYTHDNYKLSNHFAIFKPNKQNNISYEDSFIYKQRKLDIKQKEKEILQLEQELYPSIKLFSTYNFYEKDKEHMEESFELDERNYVVGVGINIVLFEGFKYDATKRKLKAELKQLNLQNEQYKKEFYLQKKENQKEFSKISDNIINISYTKDAYEKKTDTIHKLDNVKNIDTVSLLDNEIKNHEKNLELQSSIIQKNIKLKEMEIIGVNIDKVMLKKHYSHKTIKEVNVRKTPFLSGDILKILSLNTKINIEYCNRYGWCKLWNEEAYVAQFLIEKLSKR
jgi:outer membrane protein TolC